LFFLSLFRHCCISFCHYFFIYVCISWCIYIFRSVLFCLFPREARDLDLGADWTELTDWLSNWLTDWSYLKW
jgi:hypothetical protein